ncbi:enoyl-CoA hydratase/isomerase family protein [Salinarimonas sp.]|uniref:enoyl-CoA hydratase/isomerase family protein n=1 Tax=Salinarimonas sp. TaxID=2766526 RepID=UPI0032D98DDE
MTPGRLATLAIDGPAARVTLARPQRHNALVPELLADLRAALAEACASPARTIVLAGEGRSFSTGGDVGAFRDAAARGEAALRAYAGEIVGLLNAAILDLVAAPVPVIASVRGAVTGGAAGLVLAADLVALADDAFLQPWYGAVGFAPDGGWTALLPERIGPQRALGAQAVNARIAAPDALRLGLADAVTPAAALEDTVSAWLAAIAEQDRETLRAARRLVWDDARRAALALRLEAERQAFLALVVRPETRAGMEAFLARRGRPAA